MTKLIIILISGLICEAVGVVFLSKGLKQIGEVTTINAGEIARLVMRGVTNPNILLGVLLEAIFFGTLLVLMKAGDVSFVWPLTSLGFVLTTLAARFILHEQVTALRWSGVILIVLGAGLITFSEKIKERAKPAQTDLATGSPQR